jgi:hypothetical protein
LVVEQAAVWRDPDGEVTGPAMIASSFTVEDGLVKRTMRYDSLSEALATTGMTMTDEVARVSG